MNSKKLTIRTICMGKPTLIDLSLPTGEITDVWNNDEKLFPLTEKDYKKKYNLETINQMKQEIQYMQSQKIFVSEEKEKTRRDCLQQILEKLNEMSDRL